MTVHALRTRRISAGLRLRGTCGFTLLELLVAVTVLGLILLLALNGLRFGARSWEAERNHSERTSQARAMQDYLRRQFALIVPLTEHDGVSTRLAFSGGHERLQFVASMSRGQQHAGRYVFTLQPQRQGDGERLVLEYALLDPALRTLEGLDPQHVVLLDALTAVTFDYFGSERRGVRDRWSSSWPADAAELPKLLRLRIEKAGFDLPLELSVPLRIRTAPRRGS